MHCIDIEIDQNRCRTLLCISIQYLIFIRIKSYIHNVLDTNENLATHQVKYFLMLTLYKQWIKNVDNFLDKTMRNPKDLFSRHLRGYMLDEEFLKTITMKGIPAKIALNFHRTEERNFGLDNAYYPTLNRKNGWC